MTKPEIPSVFQQFRASGTIRDCAPFGSGHIHRTWLIRTVEDDQPDYILQKINDQVFPPVAEMMDNIRKIISHIRDKSTSPGEFRVPEIIATNDDKSHYTDPDGSHWRMYRKVEPGVSYDVVPNDNVAFEAGKAFGKFIGDLKDFPAEELFTVIPGFHSVEMRYEQLNDAVAKNRAGHAAEVEEEISFAREYIDRLRIIPGLEKEGKLPVRVTHNDTKLNNILFDEHDHAVCVIDLDTVMPGLSLYDFGDLVRSAANTGKEDEENTDLVQFNVPVFRAIAKGFLESTAHFLTEEEAGLLTLSAHYMTYIMGIRFLADYLSGDIYYQISYPGQNLRRCRSQFTLIKRMMSHDEECNELIRRYYEKFRG